MKVTALEAILSSSRLGDRPLLFQASRDSFLSLVVVNVDCSLSFLPVALASRRLSASI
jgi:hypothetical protein